MTMISMKSLPTEKPSMSTIIPQGHYIAKIKKSEMKQPKDETKPMYFSAECDITDPVSGTEMGKFWINLFESEAPLARYQLARFIAALKLPIQMEFELKDLTKMVNGKSLEIDICPEDRKDDKPPQRSVVDISAECFYPLKETATQAAEEVFSGATATAGPSTQTPPVMASY